MSKGGRMSARRWAQDELLACVAARLSAAFNANLDITDPEYYAALRAQQARIKRLFVIKPRKRK